MTSLFKHRNFDFKEIDQKTRYQMLISAVVPRPIAFVSTIDLLGRTNIAPFSFYNAVSSEPAVLMIAVTKNSKGESKDTLKNIEETGEFVINSANEWLLDAVNSSSAEYPHDQSEFELCSLTALPSLKVKAPRLAEAAVSFECRVLQKVEMGWSKQGSTSVIFGEVLVMHVAEAVTNEKGLINFDHYSPLSRLGGSDYGISTRPITLKRPKFS